MKKETNFDLCHEYDCGEPATKYFFSKVNEKTQGLLKRIGMRSGLSNQDINNSLNRVGSRVYPCCDDHLMSSNDRNDVHEIDRNEAITNWVLKQ